MLAWARDRQGQRVHVGDLERRSLPGRAPFACPRCGEEVVARLGRVRARHFAHRPGSTCPLAAPETALHHNAKERLLFLCFEAFAGRRAVRLERRCPGCRRPTAADLAGLGDGAVLEGSAGALRADVLVTRGGAPALALEVRVAHAIPPGKEDALAQARLPALEIDARGEWERAEGHAAVVVASRSFGFPPCPACATSARAERDRGGGGEGALVAELESYRARGLIGPAPGPPGEAPPLSPEERLALERSFRCPECGGRALEIGLRLARHACGGTAPRAVAWRGYDGRLVSLAWWRK